MNHTTLALLAVLAAAAVVIGTFTSPAFADSVTSKQINKQKAKCISQGNIEFSCNLAASNALIFSPP
jgi:hypothetical protein